MNEFDLEDAVKLYGHKLFCYAYSLLCDYHEAEDVVQDTFIAAYCGRTHFDGENLSAWLYKITYNKCIDRMRRHKTISLRELREDMLISEQDFDSGYSPAVICALKRLPYKDRVILLGRINESLSYEELSERLGMSKPTVRKRYERAKKKLGDYLRETESEVIS